MTVTCMSRRESRVTVTVRRCDIRRESQPPTPTHPNPARPMSLGYVCVSQWLGHSSSSRKQGANE